MLQKPPRFPAAAVANFVAEQYGCSGAFVEIPAERDLNIRIDAADGPVIAKVVNAQESGALVEAQVLALDHVARTDPDLPIPRVLKNRDGKAVSAFAANGQLLPLFVLCWLEGEVIADRRLNSSQYEELGALAARLTKALQGYVHPDFMTRDLVWNTSKSAALIPHLTKLEPKHRELAQQALFAFRDIIPLLERCPAQVIHGDVHPYNALISKTGQIAGIIDFGDMIHAARVIDLGNLIADCLLPDRDLDMITQSLTCGYTRVLPLGEDELELLPQISRARLAVTSIVSRMRTVQDGALTPQVAALDSISLDVLRALGTKRSRQQKDRDLPVLTRRLSAMGAKPLLFYDPPLHIVKGESVWLTDSAGRRYLDCYNNVAHVGHAHPAVARAVSRQLGLLNTNTRYLTDESIAFAERLKATVDPSLDTVVFVNSGSEANDVAIRMAKIWSGHTGALAMDFAYHGVTEVADAVSPSNYPPGKWRAPHVRLLEAPDGFRGPVRHGEPDFVAQYLAYADVAIRELSQSGHGVAFGIIDSAFMTNGILHVPKGYVAGVAERVRAAGGLFIADEVQSGFGRMGPAFWGHQHHDVVPDFVTIGKPAGNGYPLGAVITRAEILDRFISESGPFFSTFGGGNAACAAGLAVLDVIESERLVERAHVIGGLLRDGFRKLGQEHTLIGEVRGVGLATGVELVRDRVTLEPANTETKRLLNLVRDESVLIGSDGKHGNVLKIRPPLAMREEHVPLAIAALDRALRRL